MNIESARKASDPANPDQDQQPARKSNEVDYETAIEATGYWTFHYLLLVVCGTAAGTSGMEVMFISFILPAAECDLQLASSDKGVLSAVAMLGIMTGCYIFGGLSDSIGRRVTLICCLSITALFGMFSSLALNVNSFILIRFIAGCGVGGTIPVSFTYFAEFQPKGRRGAMVSLLGLFRSFGQIAVSGVAWIVLPLTYEYVSSNFRFNSWRLFTVLCGIPSLLSAVAVTFLPESPRYLLSQGDEEGALKVLRRVFKANTGQPVHMFPFDNLVLDDSDSDFVAKKSTSDESILIRSVQVLHKIGHQTKMVFHPSILKVSLLLIFINFAFEFGYFGLWMWFPELFNRLANYYQSHNESITICEVINYVSVNETLVDPLEHCDGFSSPLNDDMFIQNLVVAIVPIIGNIWSTFQMDKLGRNFFLVSSLMGSGIAAGLIGIIRSNLGNSILSSIFNFLAAITFNTLNCLGTELFPTNIRGTAFALTLVTARFGAFLGTITFGYLLNLACTVPIILITGLLIAAGLLGFLLPNKTNQALE